MGNCALEDTSGQLGSLHTRGGDIAIIGHWRTLQPQRTMGNCAPEDTGEQCPGRTFPWMMSEYLSIHAQALALLYPRLTYLSPNPSSTQSNT